MVQGRPVGGGDGIRDRVGYAIGFAMLIPRTISNGSRTRPKLRQATQLCRKSKRLLRPLAHGSYARPLCRDVSRPVRSRQNVTWKQPGLGILCGNDPRSLPASTSQRLAQKRDEVDRLNLLSGRVDPARTLRCQAHSTATSPEGPEIGKACVDRISPRIRTPRRSHGEREFRGRRG